MTYSAQRLVQTKPKVASGTRKRLEHISEVSEETLLIWLEANLVDSAWVYIQDNDKDFRGKGSATPGMEHKRFYA